MTSFLLRFRQPARLFFLILLLWVGTLFLIVAGRQVYGAKEMLAAQHARDRKDYAEMRQHLEKCLSLWPRSPDLHFQVAEAALREGDLVVAQAHLSQGLELKPADNEQRLLSANLFLRRGLLTDALLDLREFLKIDPDNGPVTLLAAQTARRAAHYDESLYLLEKCQKLNMEPSLVRLEYNLNQIQMGEIGEKTLKDLQLYLDQDHPQVPFILEALTRCYLRMSRPNEAMDCLKVWLHRRPDDRSALTLQGNLHRKLHILDKAQEDYEHVLDVYPEYDEARQQLADMLLTEMRNPKEALPHYETLVQRSPDRKDFLLGLANCWKGIGETDKARTALDRLATEGYQPAYCDRGCLALEEGQPAEAEIWLRKAAEDEPLDHRAVSALLEALRQQGKEEEARQLKKKGFSHGVRVNTVITGGLRRTSHNADLRYEMGMNLLETGRDDDASDWFMMALADDPNHAPSHEALADYFSKRMDKEKGEKEKQECRSQAEEHHKKAEQLRKRAGNRSN
jgi:tetratricopeptide (TPR) repeat protein